MWRLGTQELQQWADASVKVCVKTIVPLSVLHLPNESLPAKLFRSDKVDILSPFLILKRPDQIFKQNNIRRIKNMCVQAGCMDCAINCGIVITPGSRKCALFCTLPWHDWKTMVPWIGHFNIKCACTSQGKGVLSITFSGLSEAALTAPASLRTHLQLCRNIRLNLLVHIPVQSFTHP